MRMGFCFGRFFDHTIDLNPYFLVCDFVGFVCF
jgi:hypothetical protein